MHDEHGLPSRVGVRSFRFPASALAKVKRKGWREGDTALLIAAAAYHIGIVDELIARGADVRAKNRLGAEPLHYAVDGIVRCAIAAR
jgi:ankyrin repeat protein